jgi:ribose 5-phosphate isomerase B
MKVAVGSDHRGFQTKKTVINWLNDNGHEAVDVGTDSEESCDYPDFAAAAARLVHSNAVERAILVCGTGMGMAITANKFPGVYAAVCNSDFESERIRQHNNANCMCIPEQITDRTLEKMIADFTTIEFGKEENSRHLRRIDKIKAIEDEFSA